MGKSETSDSSSDEEYLTMVDVQRQHLEVIEELSNTVGDDDATTCSYEKGYLPIQGVTICLTCQKRGKIEEESEEKNGGKIEKIGLEIDNKKGGKDEKACEKTEEKISGKVEKNGGETENKKGGKKENVDVKNEEKISGKVEKVCAEFENKKGGKDENVFEKKEEKLGGKRENIDGKTEEKNGGKPEKMPRKIFARKVTKFDDREMAGFCVACALKCHKGHETRQIGPKRNFRCDCGNNKFLEPCKIFPNKCDFNYHNKYSHNFQNKFCKCDVFYDDDNSNFNLYLCTICEDWFHVEHLDDISPLENQDFICLECSKQYPILTFYKSTDSLNQQNDGCLISNKTTPTDFTSLCMPIDWRLKLCKCKKCNEWYNKNGLTFLLDSRTDPNQWAEKGRNLYTPSIEEIYEKLSQKDKKEFDFKARDYIYLEKQIKEYFEDFYVNKKVVTEKDIKAFFKELRNKKENFS